MRTEMEECCTMTLEFDIKTCLSKIFNFEELWLKFKDTPVFEVTSKYWENEMLFSDTYESYIVGFSLKNFC